MKKAHVSILLPFLMLAAAAAAQAPAASAPAQSAIPAASTPMHHMHATGTMPSDHAQIMKDHAAKMRAALEQMKTNALQLKTPALKKHAQLEIQLWEGMVQHMEAMASMIPVAEPPSAGTPDMPSMHHGMSCGKNAGSRPGCCGEMKSEAKSGCCAAMKTGDGCCSAMDHGDSTGVSCPHQPAPAAEQKPGD